jgi:hypothetical protein
VEPKALSRGIKRYGRERRLIGIPKYRQAIPHVELFRSHSFLGFFFALNYVII